MSTPSTAPAGQPPLALALVLQALGGLVLGALLAIAGSSLGSRLLAGMPGSVDQAIGGVIGALAGYPIGAALGVMWVGQLLGRRASLWPVLLGAAVGTWAPLLALALGLRGDTRLLWGVLALTGLFGALGAHAWRHHGTRRSSAAE